MLQDAAYLIEASHGAVRKVTGRDEPGHGSLGTVGHRKTGHSLAQIDHAVARCQRFGHLGRDLLDKERFCLLCRYGQIIIATYV